MKAKSLYTFFLLSLALSTKLIAQNPSTETITIGGTKFTSPLIEKWIAEYTRINPNTKLQLIAKNNASQNCDLFVIAQQPALDEIKQNQAVIYTGRYALLPVTNKNNPILLGKNKKGMNKKELDNLFFEITDLSNDEIEEKPKFNVNIYSSGNKSSISSTLAGFYGHTTSEIRGKKVFGEEIFLLSSVKKDSIGIAYNSLGYLYNINTRSLKEDLALLPLDLKKEAKPILSGNLDEALNVLETTRVETIPVEKIGFVYNELTEKKEIAEFLKWVLTEGQKYNHDKGFLTLNKELLAEQTSRLSEKILTLK